jgi:hypothetical protein
VRPGIQGSGFGLRGLAGRSRWNGVIAVRAWPAASAVRSLADGVAERWQRLLSGGSLALAFVIVLEMLLCPVVVIAADASVVVTLAPMEGRPGKITGRVVVEDQQGGVLLEDAAGVYWTLEAKDVVAREAGEGTYERAGVKELAESLKAAAGGEAVVVETKNYVIVSRASRAYASWCGSMFERLRNGFLAHWEREKVELKPNQFPLPILVLQNKGQFREYAVRDGAAEAAETFGYYSARTNRVVMYDLTADQGGAALGESTQREEITRRLSRVPASVATVVHEAVHQLAFNTGLQVRYADNPMWVSEGLAMYFETPDFGIGGRWTSAGKVNPWRLKEFQQSVSDRPADSLATLIQSEDRFRDPGRASAAYAESWVLVQFLATRRKEQWAGYVRGLRDRPVLVFPTPEERVAEFKKAFGEDLSGLDREVVKFAAGLEKRR